MHFRYFISCSNWNSSGTVHKASRRHCILSWHCSVTKWLSNSFMNLHDDTSSLSVTIATIYRCYRDYLSTSGWVQTRWRCAFWFSVFSPKRQHHYCVCIPICHLWRIFSYLAQFNVRISGGVYWYLDSLDLNWILLLHFFVLTPGAGGGYEINLSYRTMHLYTETNPRKIWCSTDVHSSTASNISIRIRITLFIHVTLMSREARYKNVRVSMI